MTKDSQEDFSPFAWRVAHRCDGFRDTFNPCPLDNADHVQLARYVESAMRTHYSFLRDLHHMLVQLTDPKMETDAETSKLWAEALGYLLIDISPVEYHKGGWVYFIQSGEFVKIGISQDVTKRLQTLQTASPYPMKVIKKLAVPYPASAEFRLHRYYADRRRAGEWFALTADDIANIMEFESKDLLWLGEDETDRPDPIKVPNDLVAVDSLVSEVPS